MARKIRRLLFLRQQRKRKLAAALVPPGDTAGEPIGFLLLLTKAS